ncbi:retrovirus-related pol polyprotein from transposon TNT 1-94, partial [Tanacetum coccineum]
DEGVTKVKAFMTIAEDEPSTGKADARSGQWVEIIMKKRKNLLSKLNSINQELSLFPGNIVRALSGRGKRKETISSKEVVFTKADESPSETAPEITSDSESECDVQEPLPPLPKLSKAEPIGTSADKANSSTEQLLLTLMEEVKELKEQIKTPSDSYASISQTGSSKSIKGKQKTSFGPCIYYEFRNHLLEDCYMKPKCSTCGSTDHITKEHPEQAVVKKTLANLKSRSSQGSSSRKTSMIRKPNIDYKKMENLNEVRVKELRSDNGTKCKNYKLEEFYDEKSISQNFSSPCTPEQNGVAERLNITLIEATRTMLNSVNLPKQFLAEAVNTACCTQNRSIIVKRHRKTAYDVFRGRSPDISYFHVFGCHVHIHNHKGHLGNFDKKADDGFFLGYSLVAKAFRVFNVRRQEMEETYHVTFSEDDKAISKSSTEGDEINFNENRSFPDDELLVPRSKVSQSSGKDDYFPYVLAYDPLSTNNITIPNHVTPTP